eukprot:2998066-Pleurochrysis_carterae.AAC.1
MMHATGVASSTPATAAESVASNMLIFPAAASATVASYSMSQATPPGDNRISWPPGPIHVPPSPTLVLDELRRALRAAPRRSNGGGD